MQLSSNFYRASARMGTILGIVLLSLCHGSLRAQIISNNGAVISVSTGAAVSNVSEVNNVSGTISNNGSVAVTGNFTNGATTSGNGAFTIGGNWTNNGTFTSGTGSVLLNGATAQIIGGSTASAFHNLSVSNASGVSLGSLDAVVGSTLSLTSGIVTTGTHRLVVGTAGTGGIITGAGTGKYVNGNLRQFIPNGAPITIGLEIGDATNYTPVSIAFFGGAISGSGYLDVSTAVAIPPLASDLHPSKSLKRSWTITNGGVAGFSSFNPTFTFVPGDIMAGANTANFKVAKNTAGTWSIPTVGIRTATSTQATGVTSFGLFAIGEASLAITATAIAGVTPPETGSVPVTSIIPGTGYTGTVTWSSSPGTFAGNTVYTATITINPAIGYTLTGVAANQFTIAGAISATNLANSGVITAVFPVTDTTLSATNIAGVIPPLNGAVPVKTIISGTGYTGTISWSGNPVTFAGSTVYTATITILPESGYTLAGVMANQFEVAGATSVFNSADSGIITAVFPATSAVIPQGRLTANGPFCASGSGLLTWTTTAGAGPYIVVYNDGTANRTVSSVVSGIPFGSSVTPVTKTTIYTLVSVADALGIRTSGFTASTATIVVNPYPVAKLTGSDTDNIICSGDPVTFTAEGAGSGTYEFFVGTVSQGSAGSKATFTTNLLLNGQVVTAKITSAAGCSVTSSGIATTVNSTPTAPLVGAITNQSCDQTNGSVVLNGLPATGTWVITKTPAGTTSSGTGTSTTISGLSAGLYNFTVANTSGCKSPASTNVVILAQPAIPAAPLAAAATDVSLTGFSARWSASANALGYRLDVASDNAFTKVVTGYSNKDIGNALLSSISGLSANTSYYYRVRAYNLCGTSTNSSTVVVTTLLDAPAAPVANQATNIVQSGFSANWNASATAAGYKLDVSTDIGFASLVNGYSNKEIGNVTTAIVTGLGANTNYYYRVRSYNAGGTSPASNTILAKTAEEFKAPPIGEIPSVPVANSATSILQTSFNARWTASATATGYWLDVATDAGFTSLVSGYQNKDVENVTSLGIAGLSAKTVYYYRVRAYNSIGTTVNSNTVQVKTLTVPPSAPAGLTASSCSNLVTLKWSQNTDPDFLRYRIYGGLVNNPTTLLDSTANSIFETTKIIAGLTKGRTYYFRITAVKVDGVESGYGNQATTVVKTGVIPVIYEKWNDVLICSNVGDSLTNYQWFNGTLALSGGTGQYYSTNKQSGTYKVRTTDMYGCINQSNEISVVTTKSLAIYPNSASVGITLKLTDAVQGKAVISIFNAAGQKVVELQTDKMSEELIHEIAVNNLNDGGYVVQVIINQKELYYTKLIVKH